MWRLGGDRLLGPGMARLGLRYSLGLAARPIARCAFPGRPGFGFIARRVRCRTRFTDAGNLLSGQFLDRRHRLGILRGRQCDRNPGHSCATGAADPVDIIVGLPRHVEIDDMTDALDVESARRDVRSDQNADLVLLEAVELRDPFRLLHVAMDLPDREARALEAGRQFAHRRLAVAEDDRILDFIGAEQITQRVALLVAAHKDHSLLDQRIGLCRSGDFDPLGLIEELRGQLLDRRRHRGREQQCLPILGQLGADFLDIGNESHVEHAVGFVDDQQVAAVEHDLAAPEQVHQPAGGGDQHVDALFERLDLVAHLNAADQQCHRELVIFAVFHEILGDLRGKLARRLENQRPRHPCPAAAVSENVDHRQDEARGLSRSGLGDADDVAAHQDRGDDPALDRGWRVVTAVADRAQQFVGKAEIGKGHERSGKNAAWSAQRRDPEQMRHEG